MSDIGKPKTSTVSVSGDGNVVGNNNTIINNPEPKEKVTTIIKRDGDGKITNAQQSKIKTALFSWVELSGSVKQNPITHQQAWFRLNKYMKVPAYSQINEYDVDKALAWISRQKGMISSMRSAARKDPNHRNRRYKAVHTRVKQLSLHEWYTAYIKQKFDVSSMKDLTDSQLESLYRAVMRKKP